MKTLLLILVVAVFIILSGCNEANKTAENQAIKTEHHGECGLENIYIDLNESAIEHVQDVARMQRIYAER